MRAVGVALSAVLLLAAVPSCRPSVGTPISQITGPSLLAVVAQPAEADPKGTAVVSYEALAVDVGGRVPAPTADISYPILWSTCTQPKPPTENNSVASACLDESLFPGTPGTSDWTYSAALPDDPCSLFGPVTPQVGPDQAAIRPRDADVTGGYYLPIRAELIVPEALARPGMAKPDALVMFHMQRILCGLVNVPAAPIREYNQTYKPNNNPVLTAITVVGPDGATSVLPATKAAGAPVAVAKGGAVSLAADWAADSVERYPAWDVVNRVLAQHWETMRVSWYATGGSFQHDATGRSEDEHDLPYAENSWTPAGAGLVHMWAVLQDIRGGTSYASFDLEVSP